MEDKSNINVSQAQPDEELFGEASAGREPTPDEERAADRSANDVDIERVKENYEEMVEHGVNVQGEGSIEPEPAPESAPQQ